MGQGRVTLAFSLLLLTGDRPLQVIACLTSLLWQLPRRSDLILWDNGKMPIVENAMFRGLLTLAQDLFRWRLVYRRQKPASIAVMKAEAAKALSPVDCLLLWTEDDCVWAPGAVRHLIDAMANYKAVSPVVVDLLDRGFPDFTGVNRLHEGAPVAHLAPQHHLYAPGCSPVLVADFAGIFMCQQKDLVKVGFPIVPICEDIIATSQLPGPKAVIPAAEVFHLPHTRPASKWEIHSIPSLYRQGKIVFPTLDGPPSLVVK